MGKPKAQQTKKTLMLKKVDNIKYKGKSGCGSRRLAEKFFVRKNQILSILKNQDKILCEFETNEPLSKQRSACKTSNEEIKKLTCEWFKDISRRKLPISCPMLQKRYSNLPKT